MVIIAELFTGCKKDETDIEEQKEFYFSFEKNGELIEYEYFTGKYRNSTDITTIIVSDTIVNNIHSFFGSLNSEGMLLDFKGNNVGIYGNKIDTLIPYLIDSVVTISYGQLDLQFYYFRKDKTAYHPLLYSFFIL